MSDIKQRFNQRHQDDLAFHPRWVMPFYIDFGGNLFRKSDDEQAELAQKAHEALEEITDETFLRMLKHGNWRPRSAAGWLIALSKKSQFVAQMSENLLKYPQYAMMYCFAMERIKGKEALDGLVVYLKEYLKPNIAEEPYLTDGLSVSTALAVLQRLDKGQNDKFYPEKWNEFVKAYQNKRRIPDEQVSNYWDLERAKVVIIGWEAFAERYFPDTSA